MAGRSMKARGEPLSTMAMPIKASAATSPSRVARSILRGVASKRSGASLIVRTSLGVVSAISILPCARSVASFGCALGAVGLDDLGHGDAEAILNHHHL